MTLRCHPSYLTATEAERFAVCNGCGSAQAKFDFVPDNVYGLSIAPACERHDWHYHVGKTSDDKREADTDLLINMLHLINTAPGFINFILRIPRRRRALKYYEMVHAFGSKAYWANKSSI